MSNAVFITLGVAVFVIGFGTLWRNSSKFHKAMDVFYRRALNAENDEELEDVEVSLRLYAAKECWHRHHSERVREILAYIKGRLSYRK